MRIPFEEKQGNFGNNVSLVVLPKFKIIGELFSTRKSSENLKERKRKKEKLYSLLHRRNVSLSNRAGLG